MFCQRWIAHNPSLFLRFSSLSSLSSLSSSLSSLSPSPSRSLLSSRSFSSLSSLPLSSSSPFSVSSSSLLLNFSQEKRFKTASAKRKKKKRENRVALSQQKAKKREVEREDKEEERVIERAEEEKVEEREEKGEEEREEKGEKSEEKVEEEREKKGEEEREKNVEKYFEMLQSKKSDWHQRQEIIKKIVTPSKNWISVRQNCHDFFRNPLLEVTPIDSSFIQEEIQLCHFLSKFAVDDISLVGHFFTELLSNESSQEEKEHISFLSALLSHEWSEEQIANLFEKSYGTMTPNSFSVFFHSYFSYRRYINSLNPSIIKKEEKGEIEAGKILSMLSSAAGRSAEEILLYYVCGPAQIVVSLHEEKKERWYRFEPYSKEGSLLFSSYRNKNASEKNKTPKDCVIDFHKTGICLAAALSLSLSSHKEAEKVLIRLTKKMIDFSKFEFPFVSFSSHERLLLLGEMVGGYCFHCRNKNKKILEDLLSSLSSSLSLSNEEMEILWGRVESVIENLEIQHGQGSVFQRTMSRLTTLFR